MTHATIARPAGTDPIPVPAPLGTGHFRKIAGHGFGDGANSYAYSYAWYGGCLYIGTNRNILVLIKRRFRFGVPFAVWPVSVPEEIDPHDQCGEIWRYRPQTGVWDRVYRSPVIGGMENRPVPLAAGFRNMAVFQGRSDPRPAIYTIPSCGSYGLGPVLMRSRDGEGFEVVSEPGMGLGDSNVTSFRGVFGFKGRLFVTPAGSRGFNPNVSYNATILCSDDPVNGGWAPSCAPGFGNPTNVSIHDMAAFDGHLYAGTMNIRHGFELWRTAAEGPPPHRWTKVLDRGADRGIHNQAVVAMAAFGDHLYVGGGLQNGGHDRINNVGPAAAEVIRVRADGRWDLVTGECRVTRDGLKVPTSGMGPGFDNPFTGYIWRMCEHEGALYVGTFDSSSFLPFSKIDDRFGSALDEASLERFMALRGGAKLWRSGDGDNWAPVTLNGFGNPYNFGIRALQSTPDGLFVGTANPFGPRVAVRYPSGFRYEDNPEGGLEVWHGRPEHSTSRDPAVTVTRHRAGSLRKAIDPDGTLGVGASRPRLRLVSSTPAGEAAALPVAPPRRECEQAHHQVRDLEVDRLFARLLDPTLMLAEGGDLAEAGERDEHEVEAYFGGDVRNAGLWSGTATESPVLASRTLIAELVAMLRPALDGVSDPSILVIAQGVEGTCREVSRLWPDARVMGLDLDGDLPGRSPAEAPLEVLRGRSQAFDTPSRSHSGVMWIEGPDMSGRRVSLREVWRVLQPGGCLVAADLVEDGGGSRPPSPVAPGPESSLRRDLRACGFRSALVVDVTRRGWSRFFQHSRQYFGSKLLLQQVDPERYQSLLASLPGGARIVAAHLLYRASKPGGPR